MFAGNLSVPRKSHSAALLPDGRVLIAGGLYGGLVPTSSSDIVDPQAGAVVPGPAMTTARQAHSATTLLNGAVLIAGGNDGGHDLASSEIFDASSGSFAVAGNLSAPRSGHSAFLLPHNNSVLLIGGAAATNTADLFVPDWQGQSGGFSSTGSLVV